MKTPAAILVCTLPCFDYLYQPPGMLYVSPELLILCDSAYLNEFCMALTLCKDSGMRERESRLRQKGLECLSGLWG